MSLPRNFEIHIILDHFRDQKWFQDALDARKAARDRRNKIWEKMHAREPEWNKGTPAMKRTLYSQIKAAVEKEVDSNA